MKSPEYQAYLKAEAEKAADKKHKEKPVTKVKVEVPGNDLD